MTSLKRDRSSVPSMRIAGRRAAVRALGLVSVSAICLTAAPKSAHAVGSENFEWHWYSRLGMAWSPVYGQNVQGASLNLLGFGIGGRYEEGDYSEPSFVAHVVKGATPDDFFVKSEMTFAIWNQYGGPFMQPASNGGQSITVQFNQAYIEAGNFLVPGLSVWGGARFFRESYAPIGDYFYLDDLSGQGGGIKYGGLQLAILGYRAFGVTAPPYNVDVNGDAAPGGNLERFRTIFAGNYKAEFGGEAKHHVKVHGEFHVLPAAKLGEGYAVPETAKADFGGVIGAKLHLGLGQGNWSDTSVRFGTGIANGAAGGAKTYQTWGAPNDEGTYGGSFGIEAVEHVGFRIGDVVALEGLVTGHYTKAAYEEVEGAAIPGLHEKQMDFSVQANAMIFAHKNFHPVVEASFQGRKDGDQDMGTALKFSVVPTLVPTGELSGGARPHFKLIYSLAIYNDAAKNQAMSGYLQRTGAGQPILDGNGQPTGETTGSKIGQYIGARTDWYF